MEERHNVAAMIEVAYIRVYRPAEDVRLPVSTSGGDVPRLGKAILSTESQVADAWEVEWEGRRWRCPRSPRRRMLEAVVAYHRATERFGVGMISPEVADSARRELGRIAVGAPHPAPLLASPWAPPLRWFIAFHPDDVVHPMVLRTGTGRAVARLRRAGRLIRAAGLPDPLSDEPEQLAEWISAAGVGMVELDYREVGRHLDSLDQDETVTDINEAIEALAKGDLEAATAAYAEALIRWADAQAIAFSS